MNDAIREPGVFEQIPQAVRPLTAEGDFRLDIIEYFQVHFDENVQILLHSPEPDIDITFIFRPSDKGNGNIACTFNIRKTGKRFRARALFLAFNIDIPMPDDDIFEADLPENTGSIQEIFRLSGEIKKNLPEIMDLFRPEKIEDTFGRYTLEAEKRHELMIQEGRRRHLAEKQKSARERIQQEQIILTPPGPRKPFRGKLGDIVETIHQFMYPDMHITSHISTGSVDIMMGGLSNCEGKMNILINQEVNNTVAVYFFILPYYPFIKGRTDLIREQKVIVFPGRNVFGLLGISCSYEPKGFLPDLGEMCRLIRDNLPIICESFSEKNLESTYNALIPMDGNNDEEIRNLVRHYYTESFEESILQMTRKKRQRFLSRSYHHGDSL
jgi:hypothetical protein